MVLSAAVAAGRAANSCYRSEKDRPTGQECSQKTGKTSNVHWNLCMAIEKSFQRISDLNLILPKTCKDVELAFWHSVHVLKTFCKLS